MSGFYPVVIIIFISAGNYSSFNRELIHMCPLCVIGVHTRGALEVGPKKDINYSFILGEGTHRRLCVHTHIRRPHTSVCLSYTHTHHSLLISAISHFIPLYNGCAVLELSLNPCSHTLSPGPDYDTVGWGRRKTLWPCLIKMVKSWRRIGKLILPQVPS